MVCLVNDREVLIKPCRHLLACTTCARSLDACSTCQQRIDERVRLDKCIRCRVRASCKLFEPCGHVNACRECAPGFRTCPTCKSAITRAVSIDKLFVAPSATTTTGNNQSFVKTTQKSLLKEKVMVYFFNYSFSELILIDYFIFRFCARFAILDLKMWHLFVDIFSVKFAVI